MNEQRKAIEENNRMGKTRDLFKKIRDIKKTFHARMGTVKDRNSKDLREAEEIKKRWQEYTELYKKVFLTEQCKDIEENNRMGKTRDCVKKMRDTKGIFHAKMGTIRTELVWT